jgi:tetratricopeptide (TPR) repeat protein
MMLSQNQQQPRELAQAFRLFSLANLSKHRIGDAIDYCTFAIENAEQGDNSAELGVTAYYAAGTHFLFGNISKAERLARQGEEAAVASGRLEWAARSLFFRGRLRFETGCYKDALEIFTSLLDSPEITRSEAASAVLQAWIYRCDVFLRSFSPRKPQGMNKDALLFEVEAAYLTGDYQNAVKLADALLAALPEGGFLFIEQPDWRSGFSQCELLLFSHRDLLTRLLSTYRALALCRLGRFNDTLREQAQDSMRRIIREEGRPDTDPNTPFYFYAYYCVLQESGAVEVDMNTAVSMAFKRLQSRASCIDDTETKRSFLSLNHWNSALGQAAKRHKLI